MKSSPVAPINMSGQVAIVTGAGRGLGQAYAIGLAAAGAAVVVLARSADQVAETLSKMQMEGGHGLALTVDVTDRQAVSNALKQVEASLGPVDLLVNNAGSLLPLGTVWEIDPDDWWRTMEVNVRGALLWTHAVLPSMVTRGRGRIVNIASEAGLRGREYFSPYVVSKSALIRLSENLALETDPHGVSVFAMCPGAVRTTMTEQAFSPEGQKWMPWASKMFESGQDLPPEYAVQLLLKLASGKYDGLSGRYMRVTDDLDVMQARCQEIQAKGFYTLRLPRLQPASNSSNDWIQEILRQATEHHQAKRFDQAETSYRQILAAYPEHPEALFQLGALSQQQEQTQDAVQWWEKLVHYHADSMKGWFSLGNLYQGQGGLAKAEQAYRQVIALKPDAAPVYNNLGYVLEQQGQLEEAITCYQKALDLQPNCVEAEANLGNVLHTQAKLSTEQQDYYAQLNFQLGQKHQRAGSLKTAITYYRQVLTLDPTHWPAYNGLGQIYQAQNDLQGAVAIYRQGLSLINPHYAAVIAADQATQVPPEPTVTPLISQAEVTVGGYQFPAIPPVANPEQPRPFWSVVIPVYNRVDYLLECLASVLMQWPGTTDMEILVMDNASTMPVFKLLSSLGGGIIRYYRNPQNVGGVANYNAGIALARGHWVHVLHDDDCVLPGFYANLQKSLQTCPDSIGVACTGFEYINETSETLTTGELSSLYGDQRGIMRDWLPRIGVCGLVTIPAMVIRRSAHEQLGGYCLELPEICDWEIFKRYASFYDWWYEPRILARYREHTQKLTPENWRSGKMARAIRRAIEISETYLPIEHRAKITANARQHNFNYCLNHATLPLKTGNCLGALQILQETLKIDSSPPALEKLFNWLTQDVAAPIRTEMISKLMLHSSVSRNS